MKLRLLPVVITLLASTVILFGGWFVYHSYAMENPLKDIVQSVSGVELVNTEFAKSEVVFDLRLTGEADLRELHQKLVKEGAGIVGKREVRLNVESKSSPELDKWWSSALFDVAQAMETRQYTDIPRSLEAKAGSLAGLKVTTEMDDRNVYVHLSDGTHYKYVILPRVPAQMGVWPL